MNLFNGGGDVANLRFAEYSIEQRKQLLLDAQATVLVNVAQVFYQVLRSERQLDVLKNSLQVQEARIKDEQQKLNNGLSTKLALAQVKAQAANTRATLAQVEGDVQNGRTTLAFLIGQPVDVTPLSDDLAVPKDRPPVAYFEIAGQQHRRDLLAAQAGVQAARAAVDVAVAEYYPSVSLNVEGFLYREFYADASKWNGILSANLPIFSAGLIQQDVRTAWSRLRQAALAESDVRRTVQRDVDTAYQNLLTSERRIADLESEVAAADEALKQAQAAVANNLGIVLDVLTAQDQLLNAQLQLTGARYDRSIFYLDLIRTTGDLPVGLPTTRPTTQPAATALAQ
jgi:outer membrane protein